MPVINSGTTESSARIRFLAFDIGLTHTAVVIMGVTSVFVLGGAFLLALSCTMFARSLFLFIRSTDPRKRKYLEEA